MTLDRRIDRKIFPRFDHTPPDLLNLHLLFAAAPTSLTDIVVNRPEHGVHHTRGPDPVLGLTTVYAGDAWSVTISAPRCSRDTSSLNARGTCGTMRPPKQSG